MRAHALPWRGQHGGAHRVPHIMRGCVTALAARHRGHQWWHHRGAALTAAALHSDDVGEMAERRMMVKSGVMKMKWHQRSKNAGISVRQKYLLAK